MDLERTLRRLDGKGYKSYKELLGAKYEVGGLRFKITKVQGDPFAPPSVVEASASLRCEEPLPYEDFFLRKLYKALKRWSRKVGEGRSGFLGVPKPSNAMIRRSSVKCFGNVLTFRVWVGLPSFRRRVLASEASELLLKRLPKALNEALKEREGLEEWVRTWRLQQEVRAKMEEMKLIAFVADGSVLPRRCGQCEEPLEGAVPFESPPSLKVEVETSEGTLVGMGVKAGVTSVTGPAFHGKTTLIEALAKGVWDHVPGDGREFVLTSRRAFYVRSEDGRRVAGTDVSTFVKLKGSESFFTEDASGATSAAASFQEAVEAGAGAIIIDEDYTATNFLHFDDRLEELYDLKTVETLSEKLKSIKEKGLSLIVVSGGSAPIIAQSDTVIYMRDYRPHDVTEKAKMLNIKVVPKEYNFPRVRALKYPGAEKVKVRGPWLESKSWPFPIRMEANLHLEEEGQMTFLAKLLERPFEGALKDLKVPDPWELCKGPECSEVRALDLAFALNRAPTLAMRTLGRLER